jgi:Phage integrase family
VARSKVRKLFRKGGAHRAQGRPPAPRNVVGALKRFLVRKRLREVRFHDPRHTHATLRLVARVPTKVVQERLRHRAVTLTWDVYQHLPTALQQDAAERLEGILGGPTTTTVATLAHNGVPKVDSAPAPVSHRARSRQTVIAHVGGRLVAHTRSGRR